MATQHIATVIPSPMHAVARGLLMGLLLLQAGSMILVGSDCVGGNVLSTSLISIPFLLGGGLLLIAVVSIQLHKHRSLGWIRYAAIGSLVWFMASLAPSAWVDVAQATGGSGYGFEIIALYLFILAFFTLMLLLWYSRPVTTLPDQTRQMALVLLCMGAAIGALLLPPWWTERLGFPLFRSGLIMLCLVGYLGCAVDWVVNPRQAATIFPPLVRLTTTLVLLFGIMNTFITHVNQRRGGDSSFELEGFALCAAPVVAYAMVMLALSRGRE